MGKDRKDKVAKFKKRIQKLLEESSSAEDSESASESPAPKPRARAKKRRNPEDNVADAPVAQKRAPTNFNNFLRMKQLTPVDGSKYWKEMSEEQKEAYKNI